MLWLALLLYLSMVAVVSWYSSSWLLNYCRIAKWQYLGSVLVLFLATSFLNYVLRRGYWFLAYITNGPDVNYQVCRNQSVSCSFSTYLGEHAFWVGLMKSSGWGLCLILIVFAFQWFLNAKGKAVQTKTPSLLEGTDGA